LRLVAKIGTACFFCGALPIVAGLVGIRGPKVDGYLALTYVGLNLVALICVVILGLTYGEKLLTSEEEKKD